MHPLVNLVYFVAVIIFSVKLMNPLCIATSLFSSLSYLILLKSRFKKWTAPLIVAISILYPLFNHEGSTILAYFPDDNPLTKESIIYGFAMSMKVTSTLCWLICSIRVMTTDKLLYLSGKIHPSLSLIFSMTLRFTPRFVKRMRETFRFKNAISGTNILKRPSLWLSVFSMTVTWSAENSIDLSDSMKSRGYGTGKRTFFSPYSFKKGDLYSITVILILLLLIFVFLATGHMKFRYFPLACFSFDTITGFTAYFVFCMFPIFTEIYQNSKLKVAILKCNL